jgi:hypothetical protein
VAFARVTFANGNLASLEVGMDSLDDPAHLEHLVESITTLWGMSEEDDDED